MLWVFLSHNANESRRDPNEKHFQKDTSNTDININQHNPLSYCKIGLKLTNSSNLFVNNAPSSCGFHAW